MDLGFAVFYVDETNYNMWCSRKLGPAKKGIAALQTTTSANGMNIDIIACMSANGVLHSPIVERVHWIMFNDFLGDVSAGVDSEEPETEAAFILDNDPAYKRAEQIYDQREPYHQAAAAIQSFVKFD
ncbi:hypothetical protein HPB49_024497 [Dermacentor silvarum]|uniref:Uncharacterized protein n=1 Tax=Dermacentor silvarum TaxID=543639 RepID=A0ACB8D0Q3_DERSI|nr:hypothetical protein HPB49_024497 [Dermacentor silvarum]